MNKENFDLLMITESNVNALKRIANLEQEILSLYEVDKASFDNAENSGVNKFE